MPPLPALFIVVDEFSELLSQHPEFAELFVAIGRLGRSLGMHLLLASQRLDEGRLRGLETHLSYRICLKTFSASESRAVLGVPDAYHLPNSPGAAYLKTASGELMRFQTAFVSAPHERPPHGAAADAPGAPRAFTAAATGRVTECPQQSPGETGVPRDADGRRAEPIGGTRNAGAPGVAAAVEGVADTRRPHLRCQRGSAAIGTDRFGRLSIRSAPRCIDRRLGRSSRQCRDRGRTAIGQVDGPAHTGDGCRGHS